MQVGCDDGPKPRFDDVICEEPLQISLCWYDDEEHTRVFTITMRTPGDDIALAMGLLFSEGQISQGGQIADILYEDDQMPSVNQLVVQFNPGFKPQLADFQRQLITQSSCGICGKTSLKSLELKAPASLDKTPGWLDAQQLTRLPGRLLEQQSLFAQTGGAHAAALFDQDYNLLVLKEDIGRHNAVDKVIGSQLTDGLLSGGKQILLVSGRVSFELVQKAVMAAYPVLIAVGAPSSLAVNAAQRFDLTLIGFTKTSGFNVYHGHWRLKNKEN
jgi:FdhD protein